MLLASGAGALCANGFPGLGHAGLADAVAADAEETARHADADRPRVPVIDVHAHVFNAADLPVEGFIRRVVLGDHEHATELLPGDEPAALGFFASLAAMLIDYIVGDAPTAATELGVLRGTAFAAMPQWPPDEAVRNEKLAAAIQRNLMGMGAAFGAAPPDPSQQKGRDQLLGALLDEAGMDKNAFATGFVDLRQIAGRVRAGRRRIGQLFRWADWLIAARGDIVGEYTRLYGGPDGVQLVTPALVDFSHWLDTEPRSSFEDQVTVMSLLQERTDGVAMHAFAPFDPWRDALARLEGRTSREGLELVRWAVNDMGFIGVKLYPPMGFLPTGNAEHAPPLPLRAREIPDFHRLIDGSLAALYAFAEAEGVPITAHATNSNEANTGFGERAAPKNWAAVLAAHPRLRLNLAHFGGFDESKTDSIKGTWEAQLGELLVAGDGKVFADLSYFSELLPGRMDEGEMDRLVTQLGAFSEAFSPDHGALMFGTDWLMLGQEVDHHAYLPGFRAMLTRAGLDATAQAAVLGGNAARFLGLSAEQPTRKRIERWRAGRGLDTAWLAAFDPS